MKIIFFIHILLMRFTIYKIFFYYNILIFFLLINNINNIIMDIFSRTNSKKNSKELSRQSSKNSKDLSLNGGACPKGKIMRQGYITSTGKRVSKSCITSQSSTGRKTTEDIKKYVQAREKIQKQASKKFSKETPKSCPKGYILREGYKRESYKSHSKKGEPIKVKASWTKPECIKSQTGKSEKGKKLITIIEKDVLGKFGYDDVKTLSPSERRRALRKAIKEIKPLSVYRRLVALSTLNKGKDKVLSNILKEDSEWIKTQTEYVADRANSKSSKGSKVSKSSKVSKGSKKSSKQKGGEIRFYPKYDLMELLKKYSKRQKGGEKTSYNPSFEKLVIIQVLN